MVTDDERRRIATRLRTANEHSCSPDCELRFDRLADLIEPAPNSHPSCGTAEAATSQVPQCDRAALLALASGLEADADRIIMAAKNARFGGGPRMGEAKHDAYEWRSIALRIRKACGEP